MDEIDQVDAMDVIHELEQQIGVLSRQLAVARVQIRTQRRILGLQNPADGLAQEGVLEHVRSNA